MQQRQKLKVKSLFGNYEEFPIEWQIKTFEELFKFLRTGSNSRDELQEEGDIYYIHYGDIHAKWCSVLDCDFEEIPRIDKVKVKDLPFLKEGDLIIADASEDYEGSGASVLLRNVKNRNIVSGLHTIALRNIDENISSDFKTYLNSINFVKKQIIAYVTGISVYGLSKNNLKKIRIPLPPIQEQQEIASILSNVDELIQKTDQIIGIRKKILQSVMESIFSEKLVIPKQKVKTSIDQKITENLDKSVILNIGSLAHVTKLAGFEYTKYIVLNDIGEIPVIRAQNVRMGKFVNENIRYISKEVSDFLIRSQINGNEILMVFIGAGCGDTCLGPKGRWHLGPNVAKIDCRNIDPEYLCYFLQSPIGLKNTLSWMKSTAQPSLSMETIRKIKVVVFPLDCQKKIVKILNNLRDCIDNEVTYHKYLQTLKKGLIQQLLTGKIRVKV